MTGAACPRGTGPNSGKPHLTDLVYKRASTHETPSVPIVGAGWSVRSFRVDGAFGRGRWRRDHRLPLALLVLLCLASLASRSAWIGTPDRVVFDESYYVNAARVINGDRPPGGAAYSTFALGVDPNREHPPLGKVLIAASIRLLGDRPTGWRAPSLLFGTSALLGLFWLARSVGSGRWLALGATSVMAADNLFLVHGRIATLDVMALAFMLVGAAAYLRRRPVLAGVVLGIGACAKLIVLSVLLALAIFEVLRLVLPAGEADAGDLPSPKRALPWKRLAPIALCALVGMGSYLTVLLALDLGYTNFTNPLDHTAYMVRYSKNQPEKPRSRPGFSVAPSSRPVEWLGNRKPIVYYEQVSRPGPAPHTLVLFQGRISPPVIFLALPAFALAVLGAFRRRDELSFLVVAWCVAIFGAFWVISLDHNFNYLYYMLLVLPGVYLGIARMLAAKRLPKVVHVGYGFVLVYVMWAMYPIRAWGGG